MAYHPTSRPSNQTATASHEFNGKHWVFYYEKTNGELHVLQSTGTKHYSNHPVLDGDGKKIISADDTCPIAATSDSRYLQLYYVDKTTMLWKELLIRKDGTNEDGAFSALHLKVSSPATVSATTVHDHPKVVFTREGVAPAKFSVATYHIGTGWSVENLEVS